MWNRINAGACPVAGCPGSWKTDRPFYARCTFDPKHFFLKEDLLHGKVVPIIEIEAQESEEV